LFKYIAIRMVDHHLRIT